MTCALEARGVIGRGIVAFDAQWALEYISTEPIDFPLLLPDATVSRMNSNSFSFFFKSLSICSRFPI